MLKVGIIGLGVGEAHIQGYESHPECEVTTLCDFIPDKLASAKKKYPGVMITNKAYDILRNPDIDVISIASYDNFHYEQIVTALDHNKHVFVEKPLCLYEKEARHIRELLNKKPHLKMSSNLVLRKSPRFIGLKECVEKGELGIIYHIEGDYNYGRLHKVTGEWRGDLGFYSVVYGGGIHMVDLFLWLTGDTVVEVAACGNNISSRGSKFRYNDMVVSIVKFASGMTGKLGVNFGCVHPHFHTLTLYGTEATFSNGMNNALLYKSREPDHKPLTVNTAYPGIHKADLIYGFIDSILNIAPPEVTLDDIFKAMSVCFAIEKATHVSSFVPVDYL